MTLGALVILPVTELAEFGGTPLPQPERLNPNSFSLQPVLSMKLNFVSLSHWDFRVYFIPGLSLASCKTYCWKCSAAIIKIQAHTSWDLGRKDPCSGSRLYRTSHITHTHTLYFKMRRKILLIITLARVQWDPQHWMPASFATCF